MPLPTSGIMLETAESDWTRMERTDKAAMSVALLGLHPLVYEPESVLKDKCRINNWIDKPGMAVAHQMPWEVPKTA